MTLLCSQGFEVKARYVGISTGDGVTGEWHFCSAPTLTEAMKPGSVLVNVAKGKPTAQSSTHNRGWAGQSFLTHTLAHPSPAHL